MRNALNPTLDQSDCPSVILRATSSQKNGGAFNTICVYIYISTLKFIQTVNETRETHLGGQRGQQLIAGANSY